MNKLVLVVIAVLLLCPAAFAANACLITCKTECADDAAWQYWYCTEVQHLSTEICTQTAADSKRACEAGCNYEKCGTPI